MGQLEDLKLFALVVEHRSISGAATKLNIAKSAVSRRLSLLEERYGKSLIDRRPGFWEVMPAGRELHQRSLAVISEADEIENDVEELWVGVALKTGYQWIFKKYLKGITAEANASIDYRRRLEVFDRSSENGVGILLRLTIGYSW